MKDPNRLPHSFKLNKWSKLDKAVIIFFALALSYLTYHLVRWIT